MYNFKKHLDDKESILYQGQAMPDKGDKNIKGFLLIIGLMLLIQVIIAWSAVTSDMNIAKIIVAICLNPFIWVTLLFDGLAIYGLVYNTFLKKKILEDVFYCITNKRALKYETKNDKLFFGYLEYYGEMRIDNLKDNFGNLYMGIIADNNTNLKTLKDLMFNPNPENMPSITFESIENPDEVLQLAQKARQEILNSEN